MATTCLELIAPTVQIFLVCLHGTSHCRWLCCHFMSSQTNAHPSLRKRQRWHLAAQVKNFTVIWIHLWRMKTPKISLLSVFNKFFLWALPTTAPLLFSCILTTKKCKENHAYIFSNASQGILQASGKMKLFHKILQYSFTSINRFFVLLGGLFWLQWS